jgi:hypothetical protein
MKNSYHQREVAEIFDVSIRTVQRIVKSGELKTHNDKFGRQRISQEELDDFRLRNKSVPQDEPFPRAKNTPEKTSAFLLETLGNAGLTFTGNEFLRLRTPIVYAWIRNGTVLYIGMSRRGLSRAIGQHEVLTIFQETDQLLVWSCASDDDAIAKERAMILAVKPVYNNIHI